METVAFRKQKGLTILEVLAAAMLIGILAATAAWSVGGITKMNTERLASQRLQIVASSLKSYYADRLTFPASLTDLTTQHGSNGLPYILDESLLEDPFAEGNIFRYKNTIPRKIWSVGRDGANNGGDPARDIVIEL